MSLDYLRSRPILNVCITLLRGLKKLRFGMGSGIIGIVVYPNLKFLVSAFLLSILSTIGTDEDLQWMAVAGLFPPTQVDWNWQAEYLWYLCISQGLEGDYLCHSLSRIAGSEDRRCKFNTRSSVWLFTHHSSFVHFNTAILCLLWCTRRSSSVWVNLWIINEPPASSRGNLIGILTINSVQTKNGHMWQSRVTRVQLHGPA